MPTLAPCPFCGEPYGVVADQLSSVVCDNCGAQVRMRGPHAHTEDAVRLWNKRTRPKSVIALAWRVLADKPAVGKMSKALCPSCGEAFFWDQTDRPPKCVDCLSREALAPYA